MASENIFALQEGEYYIFLNIESFRDVRVHRSQIFINGKLNKKIEEISEPIHTESGINVEMCKLINPTFVLDFNCNYHCEYCYQKNMRLNSGNMTEEHIDGIGRFYDYFCKKNNIEKKFGEINIIGGEPFLESNRRTIEYISQKWADSPLCFTTNGTNVISYLDFLVKRKTRIKVSLDGTKQMHYSRRKTKDKYAFEKTIDGIKELLKNNKDVQIVTVFDYSMLEGYSGFFSLMESLGWGSNPKLKIAFIPQFNSGCDDIIDLRKTVDSFLRLNEKDNRTQMVDARKLFPGSIVFENIMRKKQCGEIGCSPYRCSCLYYPDYWFLPDGTVHFCFYTKSEKTLIGKYFPQVEFDQEKIVQLKNRRIDFIEKCKNCKYRFLCRGGCAISSLQRTGTIYNEDCMLWKDAFFVKHYDKVLKIRSKI